jgi:hypothetical protein
MLNLLSGILALPALADAQFSTSIFMSVYVEPAEPELQSVSSILNACDPIFTDVTSSCREPLTEYSFHQQGGNLQITVEPI